MRTVNVVWAVTPARRLLGNTHAEECALDKFMCEHAGEGGKRAVPSSAIMYTTMEPCSKRLSGKKPCVERIIEVRAWRLVGIAVVFGCVWFCAFMPSCLPVGSFEC